MTGASRELDRFAQLVRAAASRVDLVAPGDLDRLESRHIEDSLRLLPLVDLVGGPVVDVGSGAGFPGIPIAIARRDLSVTLLEPRRRRCAFLEEVVRTLGLTAVRVLCQRAEEHADLGDRYALAVARALAPPREAFPLLSPLIAPGGVVALFVGNDAVLPPDAGFWSEGIATMPTIERAGEGSRGGAAGDQDDR